jgi:hypothetical protein
LAFVFASVLAVIPLVIAAVSILATFLILLGLSYVTQVSFVVEFLVSLIGLGIAIDYSLLIVIRWREERGNASSQPRCDPDVDGRPLLDVRSPSLVLPWELDSLPLSCCQCRSCVPPGSEAY